jgi:hypothetical protein
MGFFKKITRSVSRFVSDPGRVLTAAATGGASELLRGLSPGIPKPGAAGATPQFGDSAVQTAAEEERRRLLNARGRASTILTGGQGLTSTASTASRALFGGG